VKSSFAGKVKDIIAGYEEVAKDVKKAGDSKTVLYIHGYANAIPKQNGRYLGRRLEALGFDPSTVAPLAKAIVAHMVGAFNTALQSFASTHANVVYVDLRPKVTAGDWHSDEIHPNANGAKKVSGAFAEAIKANIPIA
jgi:lysophospholipase L1-like esterase